MSCKPESAAFDKQPAMKPSRVPESLLRRGEWHKEGIARMGRWDRREKTVRARIALPTVVGWTAVFGLCFGALALGAASLPDTLDCESGGQEPCSRERPGALRARPTDLDTSWRRVGEESRFKVSILPLQGARDSLPMNVIHNWSLRVEDMNGQPVDDARIKVEGGMPAHDHGFPTTPRVTSHIGNGTYLLEGVKFNMSGWWQFRFCVQTDTAQDRVEFNIEVMP